MKRIMIVDDHEDIVQLTRDILSTRDYEVETAFSGDECLEKVGSFGPDMILLDLMMPGMDGFEVLDELEKMGVFRKTKMVIFTVKNLFEEDMQAIVADPILHYVHKPMIVRELLDEIESVFRKEN